MSGVAHGWASRQRAPTQSTKSLLETLGDCADPELHFAWPSIGFLAERRQLSERQIKRMLRMLVEAKLVVGFNVVDRRTGRTRTSAYWLPVFGPEPSPETIAAYEQKVGGRVSPMSPSEGDMGDTQEGDMGVTPEGDTGVTLTTLNETSELGASDEAPERAQARDGGMTFWDAFDAAWRAVPGPMRKLTELKRARSAWSKASKVHGHERLLAAMVTYADDADIAQRKVLPGFHTWLAEETFVQFLPGDDAALAKAVGKASAPLLDGAPPEVLDAVMRRGEGFARSYLTGARWDGGLKAIRAARQIAADKLNAVVGGDLARLGVTVLGPTPDLFHGGT